ERVEWVQAGNEAWLVQQAYEGMLRGVEARGATAMLGTLRGQKAIATLAGSITTRLCRVIGGATLRPPTALRTRLADVGALGFLRPPWALAFDAISDRSGAEWEQSR